MSGGRPNGRLYPRTLNLHLGWVLNDIRVRLWETSLTLHSENSFPPIPFSASALNVLDPSLPLSSAQDCKILVKIRGNMVL
jgi:hypothetical protein